MKPPNLNILDPKELEALRTERTKIALGFERDNFDALKKILENPNSLKISGADFKKHIEKDPDWAMTTPTKEWPVIVTGPVTLVKSPITGLSPHIAFIQLNKENDLSSKKSNQFLGCDDLKIAQGIFDAPVIFIKCGITEINVKKLRILSNRDFQQSCEFTQCNDLKVAQGFFPRGVTFKSCGIETINTDPKLGLIVESGQGGDAASFTSCQHLKVAQGYFPGYVSFKDSNVEKINTDPENQGTGLIVSRMSNIGSAVSFEGCKNLRRATGTYPGSANFSGSGVKEVVNLKFTNEFVRLAETLAYFEDCENLREIQTDLRKPNLVDNPAIRMDKNTLARIVSYEAEKKKAKAYLKNRAEPEI